MTAERTIAESTKEKAELTNQLHELQLAAAKNSFEIEKREAALNAKNADQERLRVELDMLRRDSQSSQVRTWLSHTMLWIL